MKILLPENVSSVDEVKERLDFMAAMKFVMIQTEELVSKIFSTGRQHSTEALRLMKSNEGAKFVGAGIFGRDLEPKWNSESCQKTFGFDQPKENADAVLEEFHRKLLNLFEAK